MATTHLAVVAALEDEIRALRSRMQDGERLPLASGLVTAGTWGRLPLLLVRTGMGPAAMEHTLLSALNEVPLGLCLQVGYAGGAHPGLHPGDLVVATALIDASRGLSFEVAPELVARAEGIRRQLGLPGRTGALVTLEEVARSPREKAEHGRAHQVVAVEMESAACARVCRAAGLPFLVVRAILDHLDYHLPEAILGKTSQDPERPRQNPLKTPPLSEYAAQARHSLETFTAAWLDDMAAGLPCL